MKTLLHNPKLSTALLMLLGMFFVNTGNAQINTWDGSSSVNWNTAANWSLNLVPIAAHDVVIPNNFDVTINTAAVCKTFTINDGNRSNVVNISAGNSLAVTGAVVIGAGTGNADDKLLEVGSGTFSCASISVTAPGAGNRVSGITLSSGAVTVTGSITMGSTDADFTFTGSGTLNVGGNMSGGTFTSSTGTVNYNAAGSQTVGVYTYNNLTLSGSGTKTLTSVASIGGNFTLSGTAITTATTGLTIGGIVTLGSGTSFTTGAFTHNVAGNWVNNGATFTSTGSTINMNGTTQSIGGSAASTFNNLTLATSGTKTFGIATTISSALTINTGVVANLGTFTHSSNTLTLGGTGQLNGQYGGTTSGATFINPTFFATATGKINVALCGISGLWTGTSGTSWATPGNWCNGIVPTASTNVIINSGGNQPVISAAAVCNSITLGSGSTIAINSTLGVSGNWTNNNSTISGSGTVTLSGTCTIGGTTSTTFPANLTTTGIVTQGINTNVNGNYSQTAGIYNVSTSNTSYTLAISGNFSESGGTFNVSNGGTNNSTVTVGGTFGVSSGSVNLISNGSSTGATITVSGDTSISGSGTLGFETVSAINGEAVFNANANVSLTGTTSQYIDLGLGTSTNNAFNIKGNFTKSGTGTLYVTSVGAVKGFVFNGTGTSASPQTLSYSGNPSIYHDYTVNSGTYVRLLTGLALGTLTNPASTFTVDGILDAQTFVISGSTAGGVKLNAAATLVTANTGGVTSTITATIPTYSIDANYTFNGVANQNTGFSNATMKNLIIDNTGIGGANTVTINTAAPTVTGTLAVNKGILNAAAFQIIGNATNPFTLASGTTFRLSGSYPTLFTAANTTFNAASTVEYFGASQTVSGTPTYGNLNINQSSGTAVLDAATTLVGTLTLSAGLLNLATFNLTLGSTAVAGTFSATRMIVSDGGELRRVFTADGSYTYPIGETTGTAEYSPVTLAITGSAYSSAQVGVTVSDAKHPNNNSTTDFLTRSWNVNQSGISACTATVTGTYVNAAADVSGTLGLIKAAQLNGAFNQASNPWVKTGGSVLSGTTLTYTGASITSGQTSAFTGITSADPTVSVTGGNVTVCINDVVTLTANPVGDTAFTYLWSGGLGTAVTATPPTGTVGGPTGYTVTVKDANGISSVASTVVNVTVSAANTWTGGAGTTVWTTPSNWSCGSVPTSATAVTISTASFYPEITSTVTINSLTMDSGTTLKVITSNSLTVADVITNNGTLTIENNANLLQTNNVTNTGSGSTIVKRNSSALLRQDYALWSSPVSGQQLQSFSPVTLAARFFTYNPTLGTNGQYVVVSSPSTTNFNTGKGYLIRMPNNHPVTPTIWNGQFTGTPNNGNIPLTMTYGGAGFRFVAVGNPYPSPIDAVSFVNETTNAANTTGTLYFWRKTNNAASPSYCSWTDGGGFVSNGEAQVFDPNDVIQTGQGFFVEATGAGTALNFDNTMRTDNHANQFFRPAAPIERHRVWLNATNTAGAFSQMLVGYIAGATNGVDPRIDGRYINDGVIALNSLINTVQYTIQGRALPFNVADVIPLSFSATTAGTYTIAIDRVDGIFNNPTRSVYLKDNLNNVRHNLKQSGYTFTATAGTTTSRFEIVFEDIYFQDLDGDGFGNPLVTLLSDTQPIGYVLDNTDCNDTIAAINPGQAEVLYNGVDDNCNGQIDEGFQITTTMQGCGTTLSTIGSLMSAVSLGAPITGYRFEVTRVGSSPLEVQVFTTGGTPNFSLTQLPLYAYATTYSIRVMLQRSGTWLGYYGTACNISSPAVLASGGATSVTPSQCGITLPTISTLIATTSLAGATGYKFKVTNQRTGFSQELTRTLHWFSLTMLTQYNYGDTYTVEVAVKTTGDFSGYGSPCNVTAPAVPSLTSQCGLTIATKTTNIVTASLALVTSYDFEVRNETTLATANVSNNLNWFRLSMLPNYAQSTQFRVRVRVLSSGVFSDYSDACFITSPAIARTLETVVDNNVFEVTASPNPFDNNFGMFLNSTSTEDVSIRVYDMIGKLVEQREVKATEVITQEVGNNYPSGVYNIIVSQEDNIQTLRVIKR